MPKILCTLPNASELINGVTFEPHDAGGMLSAEIDEDQAAAFAAIPGYEIVGAPAKKPEQTVDPELAALTAEAIALGIKVGAKWGVDRIKVEIEGAKAKAAAAGETK